MWKAPSWISASAPERRRTHPLEAAEQRRADERALGLVTAALGAALLFSAPRWLQPPVGTALLALGLAGVVGPIAWRVTSIAERRRHAATAGAVVVGVALSAGLAHTLPWVTALGWAGLVMWLGWWTATRRADVDAQVTEATTDDVTGLPRRAIFERQATAVLALAQPTDGVALFVLDLDRLKEVNDTYGHQAGDAALRVVAKAMTHTLRERDLRARWGGDEFAVLAYGLDVTAAMALAERLRVAIKQAGASDVTPLTASIGVAVWEGEAESWAHLWSRADLAAYRSKMAGRDCVHASTGRTRVVASPGSTADAEPLREAGALVPLEGAPTQHGEPVAFLEANADDPSTAPSDSMFAWGRPAH